MESFYITLPSTASSQLYSNSQTQFRVQLPQPIELSGKWVVGLSEIHVPCTWNNIDEKTDSFNIYPKGRQKARESQRYIISGMDIKNFQSREIEVDYYRKYFDVLISQLPDAMRRDIYITVQADAKGVHCVLHSTSPHKVIFSHNLNVRYFESSNTDKKYELFIDKSIKKIPPSWIQVKYWFEDEMHKLKIPHGYYPNTDHVLEAMREAIPEEYKSFYHLRSNRNGTVTIFCKEGSDFEFPKSSKGLGEMLGFDISFVSGDKNGKYEADLRGGVYGLYTYSDIIQPHIVGDAFAPLLRVIPIDITSQSHASYVKIYSNPDFYELARNRFESIEIDIRTDSGHPLKFTHGKTLVKLLFKKV